MTSSPLIERLASTQTALGREAAAAMREDAALIRELVEALDEAAVLLKEWAVRDYFDATIAKLAALRAKATSND